MIKHFKSAVATAVVLGATLAVAAPSFAAEKHAKTPTCTQEAKKSGLKDKKEIHAYVKECKAKRAEAKKAKKHAAQKMETMKAGEAKGK